MPSDLQHYPYLIIGGGMTADAAVRGIRQVDPNGPIGLIGREPDPPYNRPPLSKGLWKRTPLTRIWRNTASLGADLLLGRTVTRLDPTNKRVFDDQGLEYSFDKLLLATGGDPIRISPDHERIIYYRTLADYHRLRALTETAANFAVIGGGFIGSEIAAVLAGLNKTVTMIFPESGIGARALPAEISAHLNGYFAERGVQVLTGRLVKTITPYPDRVEIILDNGEELRVEAVVAGLGIRPNVALAQQAGLEVNNGIIVDPFLRTAHPDIFAAGDVANFYSSTLDRRMRVEHEENANLTGMIAGKGMAGQPERYETLPSVYSTLFDMNYDAVGELDPTLAMVYDWQEPFQKGIVYYMQNNRVRAVLLWNVPRGLDSARQQIGKLK